MAKLNQNLNPETLSLSRCRQTNQEILIIAKNTADGSSVGAKATTP